MIDYQITQSSNCQIPVITYRDLKTLDEFAKVVQLERDIWGPAYDDVVPVPILAVSVHSGGILIGAFDERGPESAHAASRPSHDAPGTSHLASSTMIGFVYALPGIKDGKPTQWSHMAGIVPEYQSRGLGFQLKLLQRERAMSAGLDLIQWTYDPLQAMNAHLNFAKLGVVVEEYAVNIYGMSASPLHGGNPTDRFVADWWIRKPHVERRIAPASALRIRDESVADAGRVNRAKPAGDRFECVDVDLSLDARRLLVEIPMGFTEMLSNAPDLALEWRMRTREIFTTYFGRGYRAVEFFLDRPSRKGAYLLARQP
jgi:predicted GNAT superfamily acetyltransferase